LVLGAKMPKQSKDWFTVDTEGLRQLYSGKSKTIIVRELVQNPWDEDIKNCYLTISPSKYGKITIQVEDDSPIGFRNLEDAYKMFGFSYKRDNPNKRGRMDVGEKISVAMSISGEIFTTGGKVIFDKKGRTITTEKRDIGTLVTVVIEGDNEVRNELIDYAYNLIPPSNIKFWVNNELMPSRIPFKTITIPLTTEYLKNGKFVKSIKSTMVDIYKPDGTIASKKANYIHEMGLPIQEIDCEYGINVNQRVPMSIDRDSVSEAYLQDVYAEVLNATHELLTEQNVSSGWVRTASRDDRITKDALSSVRIKRFGDKSCVFDPLNPVANDDAISNQYNVIRGSEMSAMEWDNMRKFNLIPSTTELFGKTLVDAERVNPTPDMQKVAKLAQYIAQNALGLMITTSFIHLPGNAPCATYGNGHITFNTAKLSKAWFAGINDITNLPGIESILQLIYHEICHSAGMHTEQSYHESLCKVGAYMTTHPIDWGKI
jgi:hypothetical protein